MLDNFQVIQTSTPVKFKAKHFARLLAVRTFQEFEFYIEPKL